MVKQGDIIMVNFNPQLGHEQAGYRPAVIISNDIFNEKTKLVIACPITSTDNGFPLHVEIADTSSIKGFIMCEQIKTLDLNIRDYKVVDIIKNKTLSTVLDIIYSEIEKI